MSAIIMDGRALSAQLMPELRAHARHLSEHHGVRITLGAVLASDNPGSVQYVKNKRRMAHELGFDTELELIPAAEADSPRILAAIKRFNQDPRITGILLQLPVPPEVNVFPLFDAIAPHKDVDGVGAVSVSGFYRGEWGTFLPCTPRGVLTLLDHYKVPVDGARAAVIGRSDIAGKPIALILGGRMRNATVTWCHRHTRDLEALCRASDLVISCAGAEPKDRAFMITADMIKPGACVIDVGFRRIGPGRFAGDVDFEAVKQAAGWITPNPGGTGPMTVVALMQNLIDAGRYNLGLERATYSV